MIRRTVRAERGVLAALTLLVLVTAFFAAAVPRLLTTRYDQAVRQHVGQAVPASHQLAVKAVTGTIRSTMGHMSSDSMLRFQLKQFDGQMSPGVRGTIADEEFWASTPGAGMTNHSGKLVVGRSSSVDRHIRYTSGQAPGTGGPGGLEIGMSAAAAQKLGVKVGDVLKTGPVTARVTGLYVPVDPGEAYWLTHPDLKDASVAETQDGTVIITGTGVLSAAGYEVLYGSFQNTRLNVTWTYTPDPARLTASNAPKISADVKQADLAFANINLDGSQLSLDTQFDRLLDEADRQVHTAQTVLSLALAGLLAVALGVIVLAGELLLERMRPALALMRARGASLRQVAGIAAGLTGLGAVPAGAAGYGLALLAVPGPADLTSSVTAPIVVAAAVLLPAFNAARSHRRTGRGERRDLTAQRPSPRRLVIEALLAVLAVTATYLLRRRGVGAGTDHGVDPLLATVPALLALACGLFTLRVYPYPLRLVGRLAARARAAVSFVGVARASRQSVAAALPLTVLLLATAIAGFSATVDASLSRTQRLAAWESVGGDIRLDTLGITDQEIGKLERMPGVRGAVPAQVIDSASLGADGTDVATLTMIGVDLDAYRHLLAGSPVPIPPAPGGSVAPALFSPAAAKLVPTTGKLSMFGQAGAAFPIRDAGTVDRFPGQDADAAFVVVPYKAVVGATNGIATTLFVRGDADPKALERAVPAARPAAVTYVSAYHAMTGSALVKLVHSAFGYGALAADAYSALAILLALVIGEQSRGQAVAYLRVLGLSRREARRLALVEVAPMILAAAIAGWALGLLLPRIVGTALDLRSYAAEMPVAHYLPDMASTALFAGGLLVFAAGAVLTEAAITARRRPATTLRMGENG